MPWLLLQSWQLCCVRPNALGTTIGDFSIEQIYVNVPELDVFVQATDAQGQPISPDLVRAAGVELYLGDEKIPTGNIGMANEPICYVLAVDNSVDETTLKEYRIALRRLISAKGAKDQIMLYTLAGDAACVLPATIDTRAAVNAVNTLESQEENEPNLVQAATIIYNDINENYQSIAPRKVIFALTEAGNTATSTALLGAVAKDAASRLNMPLDIFVTVDDANPLAELGKALGGDKLDVVHESELADTLAEKQQALANALEIKTAVDGKILRRAPGCADPERAAAGQRSENQRYRVYGPPPGQTGGGKRDAAWPLCHDHSV